MSSTTWTKSNMNNVHLAGWIHTDPEYIRAFGENCYGFMLEFRNDTSAPDDEPSNLGYVLCITNDDDTINDIKKNYKKGDLVAVGKTSTGIGSGFLTFSNNRFIRDNQNKNIIGFKDIEKLHYTQFRSSASGGHLEGILATSPMIRLDQDRHEFLVFSLKYPPYQQSALSDPHVESLVCCAVLYNSVMGDVVVNDVKKKNFQAGEEVHLTFQFRFSNYEFGQEYKTLGLNVGAIKRI